MAAALATDAPPGHSVRVSTLVKLVTKVVDSTVASTGGRDSFVRCFPFKSADDVDFLGRLYDEGIAAYREHAVVRGGLPARYPRTCMC